MHSTSGRPESTGETTTGSGAHTASTRARARARWHQCKLPGLQDPPTAAVHKLSFTDSAAKVLELYADMRPMHYTRLTELALHQAGW